VVARVERQAAPGHQQRCFPNALRQALTRSGVWFTARKCQLADLVVSMAKKSPVSNKKENNYLTQTVTSSSAAFNTQDV